MTQNVWQIVYLEGTPVGAMWVTPDFRVLGSDYNTYDNVGTPIQTILSTINQSAINNCFAVTSQLGAYNFYMLFLCTGNNIIPDTICVYEMHLKKWQIWKCADTFLSGIYYVSLFGVPRLIINDSLGTIRNFDPSFQMDRSTDAIPVPIVSTMTSAWLNMGDPMTRKALNEMELGTIDPLILVSVQGATEQANFLPGAPTHKLVTNVSPIRNLYGNYKVMLAGTESKDRTYQYTIQSTSTPSSLPGDVILANFTFEVIPLNRI
jgi:hypothetical protein